jgi:hypothetical protein
MIESRDGSTDVQQWNVHDCARSDAMTRELPPEVADAVRSCPVAEWATVTRDGLPIDTPLLSWTNDATGVVEVSTGLAYPVKAERARRNPKVGLLFEAPDGTVVSMAAYAAVRDADVQANAVKYARLAAPILPGISGGREWQDMRRAVWYWARIFVENTPVRVEWWPSGTSADEPPEEWRAPADLVVPASDPAPAGVPSARARWRPREWRVMAAEVMETMPPPHLTTVDPHGFPRPVRVARAELVDDGFDMRIARGAGWVTEGRATLCFSGRATFAGTLSDGRFHVERSLPDLPLVQDPSEIFGPSDETRRALLDRLQAELERRGQPAPEMPVERP